MFKQDPEKKAAAEEKRLLKKLLKADDNLSLVGSIAQEAALEGRAGMLSKALAATDYWRNRTIVKSVGETLPQTRDVHCLKSILPHTTEDNLPDLLRMAIEMEWQEGRFEVIAAAQKRESFSDENFATMASLVQDTHVLKKIFQPVDHPARHGRIIAAVAPYGIEVFSRFWGAVDGSQFNPNQLAAGALSYCKTSKIEAAIIKKLLDAQLNVNFENGAVMTAVLRAGHLDLAIRMIEQHQFETSFFQSDVYPALLKESAPSEAISFAKKYTAKTVAAADADAGFQMLDDVSIARTQALPNNGMLTMIFNFGTAQQILITQLGEQVAPATVINFAQIQNTGLLQAAAASFVARGGKVELVIESGLPAPIVKSRKGMAV